MGFKLSLISMIFVCSSAYAAKPIFRFTANQNSVSDCRALGFTDEFNFFIDQPPHTNIGKVKFIGSGKGFIVFHERDTRWKMLIMGSWSEAIYLDFGGGTLSYTSSRQGMAGTCVGSFKAF